MYSDKNMYVRIKKKNGSNKQGLQATIFSPNSAPRTGFALLELSKF